VKFLVLDMNPIHEFKKISLILGHPSLATTNATIFYRSTVMNISIMKVSVKLNIFKPSF